MAYIIIWFITPEAKSITDKMQLKGDPITFQTSKIILKIN
jgi:hypothetical protein